MKKSMLMIAMTLVLTAGCVTIGKDFPVDPVKKIVNGKTSKAEILHLFGSPYQQGIEDGKESWTYYRIKYRGSKQTDSKELHLVFDREGKVESYSYTGTPSSR